MNEESTMKNIMDMNQNHSEEMLDFDGKNLPKILDFSVFTGC